jgi:NADPH-dependent 2,4-dienoyl-CoA reductase/sulfur reductase-like enzyme
MQYPPATFAASAKAIRHATGVPVLYAGRVNDPAIAEQLLADGVADLVGMTRALLADPELPRKVRAGRTEEIRKCVGCNTCIGTVVHAEVKTARCAVNPHVGRETTWLDAERAARARRVVVVGGGPAGIEAALAAVARGHRVTVLEREDAVGGLLRVAARAPRRDAFLDYPVWAAGELARRGVEVRCGVQATAETVRALAPDAVVVATGGVVRPAEFAGAERPQVVQFTDVLTERVPVGRRVLVVSEDDHMITPSVADFLASRGHAVEIVHKWLMIAEQVDRYTKGIVFHRLHAQGVVITPSTRVRRIDDDGSIVLFDVHTGEERLRTGIDTVVLCLGTVPNDGVYRALEGQVPERHLAGSAFAPRGLADATLHGASVGRLL